MKSNKTFLTAEWRKLLMVNFIIDPVYLKKHIPAKTELDLWNDKYYISLVGFMFLNTKIIGVKIPFHINFEEVNLRFYVKYNHEGEWRRGVAFIKEIVPKIAITEVANFVYREKYETLPIKHEWDENDFLHIKYSWQKNGNHSISCIADKTSVKIKTGSEEEFITEHYWGYTKISDNKTSGYEVKHPRWEVYPVTSCDIQVDFEKVYGPAFGFLNSLAPASVYLAEGSEIQVLKGSRI